MREVLISNLPDTRSLTDMATLEYARLLNVELDNFNRNLNKYVSKVVVSTYTSDVTLSASDELVLCNGTFTATLPPVGSCESKLYYIKNIGTGVITVSTSDTIDGETTISLSSQDDFIAIISDKTEWQVVTDMAMGRDRTWTGDHTFSGTSTLGGSANYAQFSEAGTLGFTGTAGIQLPHIMQSDSTTQSIANVTLAQVVTFNTDVHHFGITRTSSSRFTITKEASYLIAISAVCDTSVANKQIEVWLRVNGSDVANSNTIIHMPSTVETTLAVTFIQHFDADDYFEFWMTGDNTGCNLKATAAGTTPTRPACPSIIMTTNYTGVD